MKVQICIGGYQGPAITIGCVIDDKTGVLTVGKQYDFTEKRMEGFALVTNLDLPDYDFLFTDDHLREAIRNYFRRVGQETIGIAPTLLRYQPDNRIERDAVDESGPRYRISPDIDNGQLAVLAAVAYAESQGKIQSAISAAHELSDFYGITTI